MRFEIPFFRELAFNQREIDDAFDALSRNDSKERREAGPLVFNFHDPSSHLFHSLMMSRSARLARVAPLRLQTMTFSPR